MDKTQVGDAGASHEEAERAAAAEFLRLVEVKEGSNRFLIGSFDGGITLYKQQVRALNLLYAIHTAGRLSGDRQQMIAVVGGGAAGVAAAAAAIVLGYQVYLFERRPLLLHLQQGCDTRWIHPHIYEWPEPGSERRYAGLPFLNWQVGTAAEVAEQIEHGLKALKARPGVGPLRIHRGANLQFSGRSGVSWEDSRDDPKRGYAQFSAIIFAVGFGVEQKVERKFTPSYWRNDSMNQPEPGAFAGEKTKFFISGTGDGGLIDLLRACVENFNQGRIIPDLVSRHEPMLISELQRIKREWRRQRPAPDSCWLYLQYNDLTNAGLLDALRERLLDRRRKDTSVVLNGALDMRYALRLDKASVFNTLLTYILHGQQEFRYVVGECQFDDAGNAEVAGESFTKREYNIFIRHGTDRQAVFKAVQCEQDVTELRARAEQQPDADTSQRIWPAGWWEQRPALGQVRREFVPPATRAIATTFVSTLSDSLKLLHRGAHALQFRVTLLRLINIQGGEFLQQISRYAGTDAGGPPGRLFEARWGVSGLACRLGKPVIVSKGDDFAEVSAYLRLDSGLPGAARPGAPPLLASPLVFLACPFFAPALDGTKPTHVSLVLFMVSTQSDFFDEQVLRTIYAASKGFVSNLETMHSEREVNFASADYAGYAYAEEAEDTEFIGRHPGSIRVEDRVFNPADFTFKTVKSFDADLEVLNI